MKKLLLAAIVSVCANAAWGRGWDKDNDVSAVSPYVGSITGVDVKYGAMYFGIGTNFFKTEEKSKYPKFG